MDAQKLAELDRQCIDTLRFLSVDMVQQAESGHPGLPLGAAPMAYVPWTRVLKHHPANPLCPDRDRFVLSAGQIAAASRAPRACGAEPTCSAGANEPLASLILLASGSEVALVVAAAGRLRAERVAVRCVSMPSWELFEAQPKSYRGTRCCRRR